MIWQNNDIAKLAADNAQYQPYPDELFSKTFAIWDMDLSTIEGVKNIDWQLFAVGQKTLHTTYTGKYFNAAVVGGNIAYGNTLSSFDSMFGENDTISLIIKEDIYSDLSTIEDFQYKLITIGDDRESWFFAKLFKQQLNIDGSLYGGRLELINVKYLIDTFNDGEVGLVNNIKVGHFGETMTVPKTVYDRVNQIELMETQEITRITPESMEVFIPTATGLIGLDLFNKDGTRIKDSTFSTETSIFPSHKNEYSIIPTQFKIFSVDNYGVAHQSDITNAIRSIMFTDTISTSTNTSTTSSTSGGGIKGFAASLGSKLLGSIGGLAAGSSSLYQKSTSIGKKLFGDKTEAATQPALGTSNMNGDTSLLKLFVESDMMATAGNADAGRVIDINGKKYIDISTQDTFEINGRKGTSATFNSDLLPAGDIGAGSISGLLNAGEYILNTDKKIIDNVINTVKGLGGGISSKNTLIHTVSITDDKTKKVTSYEQFKPDGVVNISRRFNVLGTRGLNQINNSLNYNPIESGQKLLPWLRVPYGRDGVKTNQHELDVFMNYGVPRRQTHNSGVMGKPYNMENWEVYLRSNVFRPDAYSFWNWPIMYPSSVVNIYSDLNESNFINYDKIGLNNSSNQLNHWTKGLVVGDFTNNNFQDVASTFFSFKVDKLSNDLDVMESMLVTAGQAIVKIIDKDGNTEEFKFNTTGNIYGTAAQVNNKWTF